jgi:multiple sugar transport system ATP-binding protein
MVAIEKLTKLFPAPNGGVVRALESATLEATPGELLVLLGPSGSGKTTLLRLIAGLEEPASGNIRIDGKSMAGVPPEDRDVAMVFQEHALYPHMTVRDNLGFGLRLRKVPPNLIRERVQEAAGLLAIAPLLDRFPNQLSGGERQRIALGRTLVLRPRVFLLDEPFSNLDLPLRTQLRRELLKLQRRLAVTTIYVTHDQQEAMALASRIAVLERGRLQQIGTPREVYVEPVNLFVASFVGAPPMNRIEGMLTEQNGRVWFGSSRASGGELPPFRFALGERALLRLKGRLGEQLIACFRPEHARELADANDCKAGEAEWTANVEAVEPLGPETHVVLRSGGLSFVARLSPTTRAVSGEKLRLALRVAEACYFASESGERVG